MDSHSTDTDNNYDRPLTPLDEDCCGNGCNPCILDVHEKLLKEWQKRQNKEAVSEIKQNILSILYYKTFIVRNLNKLSEEYITIELENEGEPNNGGKLFLNPGQYIIIRYATVSRSFTPISWTDNGFIILVKIYKNGKFSTLLKNVKIGDNIHVRGPYGHFLYKCNSFQQIIMFSIGSGIAAMYPIAKTIVDDENEETKVYLIAGFQSLSHIPLKKELQYLSKYWNFKCTLQISRELCKDNVTNCHGLDIQFGRLDKPNVCHILACSVPHTTLILICGTELFNQSVENWAKKMNYSHVNVF